VALLGDPAEALAQPSPVHVELHYDVESPVLSCPSAAEMRAAVVQQLGYDPFAEASQSQRYEVRVKITRHSGGGEARIEWLDEKGNVQGQRRLTSDDDDCGELSTGVAFAVAVQVQLRAAGAPPVSPPAPAVSTPPPAKKPRLRPPVAAPAPRFLLGAGGEARVGTQPGVAAGFRAFASLANHAWAFVLDARATLPTTELAADGTGVTGRELGISAAPCWGPGLLDVCALGSLTLLSVRGEGVDQVKHPSAAGVGLGGRLQLVWPWGGRLAAITHVDVLVQLARQDVLVNRERAWSTAPVGVAVGLDVAAIFQ
jgi:hypothetical protein